MSSVPPAKHLDARFGADHTTVERSERGIELQLPLAVLKGTNSEVHEVSDAVLEEVEGGLILRGPESLTGVFVRSTDALSLEEDARWIYRRVLAACGGFSLYRAWNYVPQINAIFDGLENYHRFNLGRALAYSENFGPEMEPRLPAASAVGIHDGTLVTIFTAGSDPVRYVENPEQLPAYSYPKEYGPKSPSFSRGAVRQRSFGPQAYLSGTASIKGHATIGSGDVALQCEITCDNIRLVFASMDLPDPLGAVAKHYQSKIYLRNGDDLDAVRAALHKCGAGGLADSSIIVQADICRPDLDVEIELTGI
jgi:hypothetical protein